MLTLCSIKNSQFIVFNVSVCLQMDNLTACPNKWPATLKKFHRLIQSLPHASAIYWSEQLVFFCNDAWRRDRPDEVREGVPQGARLKQEGRECLELAMTEIRSITIDSLLLSDHSPRDVQTLISPIQEHESDAVNGALVQVLPKPEQSSLYLRSNRESEHMSTSQEDQQDAVKLIVNNGPKPEDGLAYPHEQDSPMFKPELIKTGAHFHGLGGISRADTEGYQGSMDELPLDETPIFKRFATILPTGLAILNQDAEAIFVNAQFHELTVHEDDNKSFKAWPYTIHQDDYQRVMDAYRDAFKNQIRLRIEFRTRGKGDTWRLLLLSPLKEDTLRQSSLQKYGGFICAIIDITPNKSAEIAEREAAREAQEHKEHQERFFDMISHEIRNPLSAVLHCAEDILGMAKDKLLNFDKDTNGELVEAAETIRLCVTHQKCILDDVLSFSKLDASLLTLSPKAVQPNYQLTNTLRMFQPEMRKRSIKFEMKFDFSYEDFHVEWVNADIVRMAQVLVNLITNAIKFTAKKDGDKAITVASGVSKERPTSYPPNVVFFNTEEESYRMDGTNAAEWGSGEALYILVAVIDTGVGISDEMQKRLFQRFQQALPRTEQTYGGSGLGLNISRKLCHLHGGEVGVKSQEGQGSTFGFFFRVRRTEVQVSQNHSSEKDAMASAELEYQFQHLNKLPDDTASIQETNFPEGLTNPIREHVPEVTPEALRGKEYLHAREIAGQTKVSNEAKSGIMKELARDKHASAQVYKSIKAQRKSSRQTVLLVEDNLINARVLRRKLEAKGFAVQSASNGREAVDAVTVATPPYQAFDVVLMDREMPVMNGDIASAAIREWEKEMRTKHSLERWHIPILGVSANVREEQKDRMLLAGMDGVIGKPYNFEDLITRIKRMLVVSRPTLVFTAEDLAIAET